MEPQDKEYYYNEKPEKCGKKRNCWTIIATILLAAFIFVIGLIIGALAAGTILGAIAAVIVLAVVLGLLLILSIILLICNKKEKDKKKQDYRC